MIFGPCQPNTHPRQTGSLAARQSGIAAAVIAVVVVAFIVAIVVVVAAAAAAAAVTLKGAHWP